MSTTTFESGAREPSAFSIEHAVDAVGREDRVGVHQVGRACSSTFTAALPLNGVATKRMPPAGTGGDGFAAGELEATAAGAAVTAGGGVEGMPPLAPPHAAQTSTEARRILRTAAMTRGRGYSGASTSRT